MSDRIRIFSAREAGPPQHHIMGGVSDLLIEIEQAMRDIHAEQPRPTWREAVARLQSIEHEGAEDSKEEEEMEDIEGRANTATIAANPPTEERSTNEQTVHVGDVDATHAVQLITDGEEAGGVRVGTI